MKIKLNRLTMDNFKGQRHFEFAPMGQSCGVYGDNATGKTTIYDAFVWLLFGKDSLGRKDFEIKPLLPDGTVADRAAITSVEAVLDVDGEEKTLKRTYYEKWSTKRGRSEATYDGNSSDYYVDEVPVKKGVYDATVADIVDEDTFRILTSVTYFPEQMKWQQRRSLLCGWAGVMADKDIMASDPKFGPLIEAMAGKTLEDYKKVVNSRRKGIAGDKANIPTRIDEQLSIVQELQQIDFPTIDSQRDEFSAKEDKLKTELYSIQSQSRAAELETERRAVLAELKALEAENVAHMAQHSSGREDPCKLRRELDGVQRNIDLNRRYLEASERNIADRNNRIDAGREEWLKESQKTFAGSDTCPVCGQKLPADKLDAAVKRFEAEKAARMQEIMDSANREKKAIEAERERSEQYKQIIADMEARLPELKERINAAESVSAPEPMPGYQEKRNELTARAEDIGAKISDIGAATQADERAIRDQIRETRAEIDRLSGIMVQRSRLDAANARVQELREQAKTITAELERLDSMLFLIDEFSRYKAGFVESSINNLFCHAEFRLFKEQINGGLEECCDVMYNGVPYSSLNNGMRINIGTDIIRTVGIITDQSVPLFVDNAEAVTDLWDNGSQQIRLVVSAEDKELRIV